MSDEIKEILDNFKIYEDRYKKCNETQFIIFYRDIHLLLDYITNLQEENERLNKELMNKFETQQIMRDATGREYELILTRRVNLGKMYEDYKSRCEKAIEWIKQYEKQIGTLGETNKSIVLTDNVVISNLLDILEDKE